MLSLKVNGQNVDLNDYPDLLVQLLISITNLEECFKSLDKRLRQVERKLEANTPVKRRNQKRATKSSYNPY